MDDNTPEHVHQHAETSNDQTHIDIAFDGLKVNFKKEYENETDDESNLDEELKLEISIGSLSGCVEKGKNMQQSASVSVCVIKK